MLCCDAILTADWHVTDDRPLCRTDEDWLGTIDRKLQFLRELSRANGDCPILCAGDVFDSWRASVWLCAWLYRRLPTPLVTVPGNHDLPMHSLARFERSPLALLDLICPSIQVLRGNRAILNEFTVVGLPYGWPADEPPEPADILLIHDLVYPDDAASSAFVHGQSASAIFKRFPGYRLIVTGDNHESFARQDPSTGAWLVNPGSLLRLTADQADHKPACYLYWWKENRVERVELPVDPDAVSRAHLDRRTAHDAQIAAYISHLRQGGSGLSLSFRHNLELYLKDQPVPKRVEELIWQHVEMT